MKQRKSDEIFELKRQIKELCEEITRLNRKIMNDCKEDKRAVKALTKAKSKIPVPESPPVQSTCQKCNNGKLELLDLGAKQLLVCDAKCGYRKIIRNV